MTNDPGCRTLFHRPSAGRTSPRSSHGGGGAMFMIGDRTARHSSTEANRTRRGARLLRRLRTPECAADCGLQDVSSMAASNETITRSYAVCLSFHWWSLSTGEYAPQRTARGCTTAFATFVRFVLLPPCRLGVRMPRAPRCSKKHWNHRALRTRKLAVPVNHPLGST